MWKKNLGLDITVKGYEGEVYWNSIVAGKLPFWRMGYAAEVPDADTFMNDIPHTQNGEKNLRWTRTDFDALVDKAKIEQNADKRKQLYLQAEKILTDEECAIIPLWSYAYVNLTKPTLTRQYSKMMIDSLKNWKSTK
jgi:oligopeptide transport system substrate-binding protein